MVFSVLFRKYPLFRTIFYIFVIAIVLLGISIITKQTKKLPVIENINPAVGSAGDTMTITGSNFGNLRETSYVEIGGSRITASGYSDWSDNQIKIVIPSNVQDGLVCVVTKSGKSKPGFFANEIGIPIEAPPDTQTSLPIISSISPSSSFVGSVVTISGSNFGTIRGNSEIFFSANRISNQNEQETAFIPVSDFDFDYESWSDSEIRVRIPDGAISGNLFVKTEKGSSGTKKIDIKDSVGKKILSNEKTYALKLDEDIDSIASENATNITLRVPRPIISSSQFNVELNECTPEPLVSDFKNTVVHQIELQKSINPAMEIRKVKFTQNFVVTTNFIKTEINSKNVKPYDKNRILFSEYTAQDSLIPCEDSEIISLAKEIVKKETNPYLQAKLVYEYMIGNYQLQMYTRNADENPLDLLETQNGDAYDFSIVFTAILRALKIPSISVAGILVDSDSKSKNHWWNEFYLEKFGWVPVDLALGCGLDFSPFKELPNNDTKAFYFGNLDNQHIAFSRGWNEIKQSLVNGKIVYRPRSFAFQSIWEETSEGSVNYSSLWNNPIVLGIY